MFFFTVIFGSFLTFWKKNQEYSSWHVQTQSGFVQYNVYMISKSCYYNAKENVLRCTNHTPSFLIMLKYPQIRASPQISISLK